MTTDSKTTTTEKWVLVATILASSIAFIDSSALDVAASSLQTDLNISATQLLWVINSYTLMLAALILIGGSLGDHYGRKRVFMIGIGVFAAASLVCGLAQNVGVLIAARTVQGIGGALMVPGSLAILSASFSPERRGMAIGTWSTFSTLTTLMGPVLGGWLAEQGLWRVVFFINLPLAAFTLFVLATRVPESRDSTAAKQLDLPGALLVTLGLAGITYGFTEAPGLGFGHPRILFTLGGGILGLLAFVYVEMHSAHPMVPLKLFKSRTFSGTNALTLLLYAALGGLPFFFLLNLQKVQEYPADVAALTFLPLGILLAIMSRRMGRLVDQVGARLPLTIGPALAGVGFFLFALPGITSGPGSYFTTYFPAVVLLGIGMGITVAPLTTAVVGSAPAESSGTASGINNAVARTARVLAIAIFGAIALAAFKGTLESRTADLGLSEEARSSLSIEASKLADAVAPTGLDAAQTSAVEAAIDLAFIDTFRLLALISAGLAWGSAVLAWLIVDGRKSTETALT